MMRRVRWLMMLLLFVLGVVVMGSQGQTPVYGQTTSGMGLAQISGPVQVDMTLTPAAGTPGDILQLTVGLQNHTQTTVTPELILRLPPGIRLESMLLPAGMTLNIQTGELNWLPVVTANGGQHQFTLQLRLETADIAHPEQQLTATLKIGDNEQTASAGVWVGIPPQINTILHPPQVAVGQPFQLRAETSGPGPLTQAWLLSDGRRVEVNDPVIIFPAAGLYEVRLEVRNPLATVTRSASITVVPQPAAQFIVDDPMPGIGQPITFINQSGGTPPLAYTWDFGDGTTTGEPNPSHHYESPGTYLVHLLVQNEFGQSEAFWQVVVGQPPVADMVIPESVPAGAFMQGQAFGDDSVTRYAWHMGDGRFYEGEFINHVYRRTGDYYVTMLASNEFGSTEIGRWIHVDPGTLHIYLPFVANFSALATGEDGLPLTDILLPAVPLDEPFVLAPIEIPPGTPMAEQLYRYINEARRQFDLPPLTFIPALSVAAQHHTNDMAAFAYTAHIGSDGSTPAERLVWQGYSAGYAGEATAWGFEHPYQAVEFWVNSDAHRRIILNAAATDVGVGYTVNLGAPNVWYWTAEFGNAFDAPAAPALRWQHPAPDIEVMVTAPVTLSWNWPARLQPGQQFVIYLHTNQGAFPVATITEPVHDTRYAIELTADTLQSGSRQLSVLPGTYEWQLKLEGGGVQVESERRSIVFIPDPNQPTATPPPATLPPTVTPTQTPTPTEVRPTSTPPPPVPTSPPPLATATPNP